MLIWCMLFVYLLLCFYFLARLVHYLKVVSPFFRSRTTQLVILILYCLLSSLIVIGAFLKLGPAKTFFVRLGNYWLGTFILLLTFTMISDIGNFILKRIHRKHPLPFMKRIYRYYITGIVIALLSASLCIYGSFHINHIKITEYTLPIEKEVPDLTELNVVLVADLHMGYSFGCREAQEMVSRINAQNPDVILIAGDIFDNNYDFLDDPDRLIAIFREMKSRFGIYAVYGNHDVTETLVGGFSITSRHKAFRDTRMDQFLKDAGVTVLEDQVVTICDDSVYLIGRLDAEKNGSGSQDRLSIEELTENLDLTKPVILLEHEPKNLEEISQCGIDVMLSGHTHGGQFFPLTIVQPLAFDNYYGLKKYGSMYSVVTYGLGVYGPRMRIFTDTEIMSLKLKFQ